MSDKSLSEHWRIHQGTHFFAGYYWADVDTGSATVYLNLVVPAASGSKEIHARFEGTSSFNGTWALYEGASCSGNGTALTAYNSDRNSTNAATMLVYRDPTVSGAGTQIMSQVAGSDSSTPNGSRMGDTAQRGNEIILKYATKYLMAFTTKTDNCRVSMAVQWYEESE